MIFVYAITTPANTPASAPLITTLLLDAGTITRIDLQFPLGVSAVAHIQLSQGLNQVFPTNPDGAFATSNETITWNEDYDLDQPPYRLTATTWNTSSTYSHTITVRIVMTPAAQPGSDLKSQIESLLGVGGA